MLAETACIRVPQTLNIVRFSTIVLFCSLGRDELIILATCGLDMFLESQNIS